MERHSHEQKPLWVRSPRLLVGTKVVRVEEVVLFQSAEDVRLEAKAASSTQYDLCRLGDVVVRQWDVVCRLVDVLCRLAETVVGLGDDLCGLEDVVRRMDPDLCRQGEVLRCVAIDLECLAEALVRKEKVVVQT
jgi:hypothetical protein